MREIWDAYDAGGNKLGFDLYRLTPTKKRRLSASIGHNV